jgi:hypothetical protein
MTLKVGVLALLEAKPGKEADLEAFLLGGQAIVEDEPATAVWYAFRVSDRIFGIFDAFAGEDGREAHLSGRIPAALGQVAADLLAGPPDIRPVDVLAMKATG